VIGFLRFFGVLNAAVWLGGAVYHAVIAHPAMFAEETATLLQPRNFPFFSRALEQILSTRYFHFLIVCSLVALVHLVAEWLYLGRPARKLSFALIILLFSLAFTSSVWLRPKLRSLHYAAYAAGATQAERVRADRSFRTWNTISTTLNFVIIGGLITYLWRTTHPADPPHFITSVKFRG
jgi:hypothetical protein